MVPVDAAFDAAMDAAELAYDAVMDPADAAFAARGRQGLGAAEGVFSEGCVDGGRSGGAAPALGGSLRQEAAQRRNGDGLLDEAGAGRKRRRDDLVSRPDARDAQGQLQQVLLIFQELLYLLLLSTSLYQVQLHLVLIQVILP